MPSLGNYLSSWSKAWTLPCALFVGIFLLIAFTSSHYGLAWDEPYYFRAADLHVNWLREFAQNVVSGQLEKSIGDATLVAAWHWDPFHVPHPPFSRIVSGFANAVFSSSIDKFSAYRLAPALFFAVLVTLMYLWMRNLFDHLTGLFSAFLLIVTPNLFGFAHIAVTDMPLTTMWFFTVYCFWRGLDAWKWSVSLGVVWGLALATKFPALLIPAPLFLWAHIFHRRSYHNNVFAMFFLSPLVMIASQPYYWHQTPLRILEFLYEGLSRGYRPETSHSIFFLNQKYLTEDVPSYYPFFMTFVSIPETILLLAFIGVAFLLREKGRQNVIALFLFNAVFILCSGLLPGAVLHDVNRLMLPALPYLIGLAGWGFFMLSKSVVQLCARINRCYVIAHLESKVRCVLLLLTLFPPSLDLLTYHPYELSYYNRLAGGIRGAHKLGLEVTYLMEAFTPDFLEFLNANLPPNAVINASFANFMLMHYQRENRLRKDLKVVDTDAFDYYILLHRVSAMSRRDWSLLTGARLPHDAFRLDGVPLILIYKNVP